MFVLSALHPEEWSRAVANVHKILKPNGLVVMRDYGRYDLTQLRFKTGRLLDRNFYIRGDKTRVYFFELDELALMFTGSTYTKDDIDILKSNCEEKAPKSTVTIQMHPILTSNSASHALFAVEQLGVDRRLIVNRKRQLKMYRVWMQGQFRKLEG